MKDRLRWRYKRELSVPEWEDDELSSLCYSLRAGIKAWQKMQRIAKERIAWNAMAYLANIDLSKDFVALDVLKDFTPGNAEEY